MFPMKKGLSRMNILYTGSQKRFPMHYGLWGNFLKRILASLYCTKCNEINIFFEMYNSSFYMQDHTKDFGYFNGYASKRLKMYFQLGSVVLNTY